MYNSINGEEPENLTFLYSIYPEFVPSISNERFAIINYPDITVWKIIRDGSEFAKHNILLTTFKKSAEDKIMGDMYDNYLDVEELYAVIDVEEIINIPGYSMSIPERTIITTKAIYRMKDGSLKVPYFTSDLYYNIDDCKKVAIKGMKRVFEFVDENMRLIEDQIKKEKEDWEQTFLDYPHLVV